MENQELVSKLREGNYLNLLIKPTNDCNFNCPYCFDKKSREKRLGCRLTEEDIIHVLDMTNVYAENVGWFWHGGELTLMGQQFFKDLQIEFSKRYATNYLQTFQSNGYLIHKDRSWFNLFEDNQIALGLSYDIKGQELRNDHKFDVLTESIDRKICSGAITVITKNNVDKLIEMYELAKVQFGLNYSISYNLIFEEKQPHELSVGVDDYVNNTIKFLQYWIRDTNPINERTTSELIYALSGNVQENTCNYHDCRGTWLSIYGDGSVHPCDTEMVKYNLGNIRNYNSIGDIFASEQYAKYKHDIDMRYENFCNHCPYLGVLPCRCNSKHTYSTMNDSATNINPEICKKAIKLYNESYYILQSVDISKGRYNPLFVQAVESSRLLLPRDIENELKLKGYPISMAIDYEIIKHSELHDTFQYKLFRIFNPIRTVKTPYGLSDQLSPKELISTIYDVNLEKIQEIMKGGLICQHS